MMLKFLILAIIIAVIIGVCIYLSNRHKKCSDCGYIIKDLKAKECPKCGNPLK